VTRSTALIAAFCCLVATGAWRVPPAPSDGAIPAGGDDSNVTTSQVLPWRSWGAGAVIRDSGNARNSGNYRVLRRTINSGNYSNVFASSNSNNSVNSSNNANGRQCISVRKKTRRGC
jgi:hypothetical protein